MARCNCARCPRCNEGRCDCDCRPEEIESHAAPGAAAVGDGASALWALRQILHDLPDERGWMDPAVEKIARGLVARNPYADLAATPAVSVGDAKDAERYRWLRERAKQQPKMYGGHQWYFPTLPEMRGATLDAAIDAAIASKGDQ